jgi:hypothetical protein
MPIWPNYAAGQKLTADLLAAGQLMVVYKTSNTDRSSTTTLTDDPDLKFTLTAGAVYWVEWFLHYAGPASGISDGTISVQWTVPSGATGQRGVRGPGTGANNASMDNISMTAGVWNFNQTVQYGPRINSNTFQSVAREEALVTVGATGGTCAIKWAQAVSSTAANRMAAGSWGRALRLT